MKTVLFIGVIFVFVVFPCPLHAQNISAYGFATDFYAQGQVAELDFPDSMDGVSFLIVWQTAQGQFVKVIDARAGRHCYELRNVPRWDGHVDVIATTAPGITGRVKTPTLSDEIDLFLAPEPVSIRTINFLEGHTLFGWSWSACLLIVLSIFAASFLIVWKKPIVPSLFLGFLMAWGLMDLRAIYDHLFVVSRTEKYMAEYHGMFPMAGIKPFAERASEIIGPSSWSDTAIKEVKGSYLRYRLAEHPFVSADSNKTSEFLVTENSRDGQVVFQSGSYFLVKRKLP